MTFYMFSTWRRLLSWKIPCIGGVFGTQEEEFESKKTWGNFDGGLEFDLVFLFCNDVYAGVVNQMEYMA